MRHEVKRPGLWRWGRAWRGRERFEVKEREQRRWEGWWRLDPEAQGEGGPERTGELLAWAPLAKMGKPKGHFTGMGTLN